MAGALVKGMIGGALKERAKNIGNKVGKTKAGKLLGREKNIMTGKPQPKAQIGETKSAIQPQQSLAPVAPDVGEGGGGSKSFKTEKEAALSIKTSTIQVATLLKGSYVLEKEQLKNKRKTTEKGKRDTAEGKLEKETPKVKGFNMPKMPGGGLLSAVFGFVSSMVFGLVMVKLIDWLPAIKKIIPILAGVLDFVTNAAIWVVDALATVIDFGYKLVDKMNEWVKNTFGEEGAEKFQTFMTNLKDLFTGFLIWKIVGEKIFKAIVSNIKFAFNVAKSIIVSAGRVVNFLTGGLAGKAVNAVTSGLSRVGGWIGKKTGLTSLKKGVGGIFKHGVKRGGKRALLKMFGKTFIKNASKIFGRVPIIGPLIVGLVSLVAGEPIGKALFKTFGAALGGFLGTIAGTALTAAAALGTAGVGGFLGSLILPASVMIGEILGTFVGDMLYGLIFEGGLAAVGKKLKEAFVMIFEKITSGVNVIKDFIVGGFSRLIENLVTVDPIPVKSGGGVRTVLTKGAKFLGLYDWLAEKGFAGGKDGQIDKFPNILNILFPWKYLPILFKSFFPPSGDEAPKVSAPPSGKSDLEDKDEKKKSGPPKVDSGNNITASEVDVKVSATTTDSPSTLTSPEKSSVENKLKTANEQGGAQAVIDSISTRASYEDGAPSTTVLVDGGSESPQQGSLKDGSRGSVPVILTGGGEDPYEGLYKGG